MGEYFTVEWLNLYVSSLALLGVVGILRQIYWWAFIRWRCRSLLRFKQSYFRRDTLPIVISTSTDNTVPKSKSGDPAVTEDSERMGKDAEIDNPSYPRQTVSIWTTYAVNEITEMSSVTGYRSEFETDISERLTDRQDGDIVLIGGGIKNKRAADFISHFNKQHEELAINRENCEHPPEHRLVIGKKDFSLSPTRLPNREITSDRVIIVMWRNPFTSHKKWRRGIMCAGFTSMGTAAAAEYLNECLRNGTLRKRCKSAGVRVGLFRARPEFIVVLNVIIHNHRYYDFELLDFIPIHKNS